MHTVFDIHATNLSDHTFVAGLKRAFVSVGLAHNIEGGYAAFTGCGYQGFLQSTSIAAVLPADEAVITGLNFGEVAAEVELLDEDGDDEVEYTDSEGDD